MRECPKCYYVDPPNWRPPPHYPDLDYCRYDEFLEICPDLAKGLLPGRVAEDALYVYRRTTTGKYVYRVWRPIWQAWGPGGWSHFRKTKMYDSAGRLNRKAWAQLMKVIGRNKAWRHSQPLDKYL